MHVLRHFVCIIKTSKLVCDCNTSRKVVCEAGKVYAQNRHNENRHVLRKAVCMRPQTVPLHNTKRSVLQFNGTERPGMSSQDKQKSSESKLQTETSESAFQRDRSCDSIIVMAVLRELLTVTTVSYYITRSQTHVARVNDTKIHCTRPQYKYILPVN